jgi:hypothetical protein
MGASDFARDVFETALSKYEAYGECLRGLAAHRRITHSALRIHQHCNRRFGHFPRTVPRGLGKGEGYGDTVVTFLERADNATLHMAAKILDLPAASLPRNTRSKMSLTIRFGGMGRGTWLPCWMHPMLERPVWQWGLLSVSFKRKMLASGGFPRRSSDAADHVWTVSDC